MQLKKAQVKKKKEDGINYKAFEHLCCLRFKVKY